MLDQAESASKWCFGLCCACIMMNWLLKFNTDLLGLGRIFKYKFLKFISVHATEKFENFYQRLNKISAQTCS